MSKRVSLWIREMRRQALGDFDDSKPATSSPYAPTWLPRDEGDFVLTTHNTPDGLLTCLWDVDGPPHTIRLAKFRCDAYAGGEKYKRFQTAAESLEKEIAKVDVP